jgi:predicted phosphohydrolase/predicted kinase
MIRCWHISDPHLSMNDEMQPIKKMNERRWAVGSWTFEGYLEAIKEFAQKNIRDDDITFITGDIVHDMWGRPVYNSFNWLRATIPGHIVICRGNHDKDWSIGKMKLNINLPRFHIVGESETTQLGPFTIGCYSDHSVKTDNMQEINEKYVQFAHELVHKAKSGAKIPVMISHYPVSPQTAELIGKAGVKAYMSGHVHCTDGGNPEAVNGVHWKWYDISAGLTDDKYFEQCFFSTGTVDVLRAKHGQPFKEIECLRQHMVSNLDIDRHRGAAAKFFGCSVKLTDRFHKADPFNQRNLVSGLICREKGLMQGSLYITHVNGIPITPQTIYGTPKLEYPYINNSSTEYKKFKDYKWAYLAEKWNGMNVLFYRYFDANNVMYITAKSKGTAFLGDSEVGNFLSLTREAMLAEPEVTDGIAEMLVHPDVQAVSCELCGTKEKHLVKYDFDIQLKQLFAIMKDGNIRPFINNQSQLVQPNDLVAMCKESQIRDLATNMEYRAANNLPHKYEYEHFAVEGKVLYLLDDKANVIDRTLYKIKPSDIEEVHWQTFNATMQGRVAEAVKKISADGMPITEDALKAELDMGPKEWEKFGKAIMQYYKKGETNMAKVYVLVGLPGSGKSTVAKKLQEHGFVRVNQDELGSRNACKKVVAEALKKGVSVVIDRCNFDLQQRKSWIDMAQSFAVTEIRAFLLDVDAETCIKRAAERESHPTISGADDAARTVLSLREKLTPATLEEGFISVKSYKDMDADAIVKDILETK